ncbi:MAG: glycosyltransferase family 2 protein [Vulcanimicrobiota bacterium]
MNENTKISVVIPTYNIENYIRNTLMSVMNQTVLPHEVIVIDDGSTDSTPDIIREMEKEALPSLLRLIRQNNSGPGAARNKVIIESTGKWIAFLDGDDQWLDCKLEKICNAIEANPPVNIVTHDRYDIDLDGVSHKREHHKKYNKKLPLFPQLYRRNFLTTSSMVIKKQILLNKSCFDSSIPAGQDYDLWLKVAKFGNLVFLSEPLTQYTIRTKSISSDLMRRYHCLLGIHRRHMAYLDKLGGKPFALKHNLVTLLYNNLSIFKIMVRNGYFPSAAYILLRLPWVLSLQAFTCFLYLIPEMYHRKNRFLGLILILRLTHK